MRTVIFTLALIFCLFSGSALAEEHSGTCGDNLTWKISNDSVLTICGEGAMNFDDPTIISPWQYWTDMIKTLEIEDGVISIAINAFNGCRSLISAHLPNSITMIESGAFTYCEKLTSIVIPSNVRYLDRCVFANCESLSSVTFAGDLEGIDENCFQGCEALDSVVLPNSVTSIGSAAFIGCRNMRTITLSANLKTMGSGVFSDCRSLESIIIPKSTTDIGEAVFFACDSLSSVTVEDGNPVYDNRDNCNAIIHTATNTLHAGCRKTTIPASVTSIGNAAFQNISTIVSSTIPNNVAIIGSYAFSGTGLSTITFPNAITALSEYVVGDCKDLRSIIIPASVTNVGHWIFAFDNNLDTIVCHAEIPPAITDYTFEYFFNQQTCRLLVPKASMDLYKAADGWKEFLNILPIDVIPTNTSYSNSSNFAHKLIRNGQLLILRDGKTYAVQGLEVR